MTDMRKSGRKLFTILAAMAVAAVTPSFADSRQTEGKAPATTSAISDNDQRRLSYFYYEAIAQQTKGNYAAAFDLLNHCIAINPQAAEAYFSRGAFLAGLKQDTLAEQDYKKAATLSPDNNTYRERLAQFYIRAGKYSEATKEYESLYEHNYNRSDALAILLQLYGQGKDYAGMIRTLDRMETEDGPSEQLTLQKMQVYDMKGDKKAALGELEGLVQKHPYDAGYKVMMGNWLMNNDRKKEALKTYRSVLKEDPENNAAQMSMLDYYRAEKQDTLYNRLLLRLLADRNTPDESKQTLIRQFISDNEDRGGDSTKVLAVFDKALSVPQHTSDLLMLKAAYLTLKKMPQDSVDTALRDILAVEPDNAGARLQLAQSQWRKQDYDGVIEICRPALEYNPDEMAFYYFLGMAYSQQDKRDEALDIFRRGVGQITPQSNADIVSDFYAIMGDILYEKGRHNEAYAAYDSCLQWKPDNYACLNNYAYYISLKGENLEKAERMSYKTIKAEPQNTTYLDTYAWILFMQKRYEEAKIYIDEALKNDTADTAGPVVTEHAGDIHAMAGDIKGAVAYWQKALSMDKNNALLQKKIKQKKYIAQ